MYDTPREGCLGTSVRRLSRGRSRCRWSRVASSDRTRIFAEADADAELAVDDRVAAGIDRADEASRGGVVRFLPVQHRPTDELGNRCDAQAGVVHDRVSSTDAVAEHVASKVAAVSRIVHLESESNL